MKILVFGPENRYLRYRPALAASLDVQPVFVPLGASLQEAARQNPDARVIFSDTMFDIDEALLDLLPRLQLVQSEGVAFNHFDLRAAADRGVFVCNCKGCNAASVAEHTVMLMLMALRCGITGHRAVREGRQFAFKERFMAADVPALSDCAVGLVGMGDIGTETARRLQPFGCRLFYYSLHRRSPETEAQLQLTYLPLEELAERCDLLSLHCAVNDQTRGMVNASLLSHFRPGAILINTARGELLDNEAVRQALLDGRLGGLAADTLAPEPTPADHPLVALPQEIRDKVLYSPHLGGNTGTAFRRAHEIMWNNARLIAQGRRPLYIVNGL